MSSKAAFSRCVFLGPVIFMVLLFATAAQAFSQAVTEAEKQTAVPDRQNASSHDANPQGDVTPGQSEPRKGPIHIVPYGVHKENPRTPDQPSGALSNNGVVQYYGGPVISNVHVVEVMWGSFVDSASTSGLAQFFTDITQSNYFGMLAEYSTVGLNGFGDGTPGSNQIIGPGVFDNRFVINPSTCPGAATNPACSITDAQIQNEIVNQLNSHALPAPVQDSQGNFNTVYMIYFPPGVTISLPDASSCVQGGFCAYHSNVNINLQPKLPYGVFPDFSQGGCSPNAGGCGFATAFQNLTTASSHELGEAVTDVDVGSAPTFAPPLGWADQNTQEEIGDFCAGQQVVITVNTHPYTVQRLMSNMQNGVCESNPPNFEVQSTTANTVPGNSFQITVSAHADGGPLLTAYNDTVHFTSSDSAAALPADYTFVPGTDNGGHTFTVTLNTTGSQTITANDTVIKSMTGSATVDAEHNPDLTVASTHTGNFTQSQTGATYTLTVTNVGDRPTNGTVMVIDNLPFGVTATAISGTGWTCQLPPTLNCTRSDALTNGQSYPAITLTVNVFSNAPPTITNSVTVSGGGEANTSNDTGNDPTTVIQLPDLTISKSHLGVFTQGEIGETYTISVSNFGFASTSGAVTVTDTLPTGLSATGISGTGWSCTLSSLTCTRSDSLADGGNSYPPITLTVNVAANAPMPSITNTAVVSGGGEVNTSNDTASDVTQIAAAASDLTISSTHAADFTQGQTGATYTLTVSNIGPLPTTGTVTVNDNVPVSLGPTRSISGPGWSCSLSQNSSCTRSDPLAGNTGTGPGTYPPITLTADVLATASTPQINSAFVSGGGENNTGNDASNDVTNVIQLADLTIGQTTPALAQGLTGANYILIVSNLGNGPTTGVVTVIDTLPAGLTATAMTGGGWSCTLSTLTCMRSDVLAAHTDYPTITLTVSVAANAPSSVSNTATVSGGGEIITSNDTSIVSSPVQPPVTVSVFFSSGTVNAGAAASYELLLNASVPGQITTACTAGVPPGAACQISTTPVTAPFQGTVIITVTTTGPQLGQLLPEDRTLPVYAALMPFFGALILLARGSRSRGKGRSPVWPTATLYGLALLFLLLGCGGGGGGGGGGSSAPPPPPVVTPPGTYTITATVSNTATNTQVTVPLTLIVK